MGQGLTKEQDGCGQRQQNEQGNEQSKKGQMAPNGFLQLFVEANEDLGHSQTCEHGNDQGVIQQKLHQTVVGRMLGLKANGYSTSVLSAPMASPA